MLEEFQISGVADGTGPVNTGSPGLRPQVQRGSESYKSSVEYTFYAHPYHSWERGLNENTNGLARQFLPKGKDFSEVTDEEIQQVMDKLNNRPRKCLGFKTPNQVFFGINPPVALTT